MRKEWKELGISGFPVIVVWVACTGKRIVVSLFERGRPTVEVWEVEDIFMGSGSSG